MRNILFKFKNRNLQTFDQTQQVINYYNFNRYMVRYNNTPYNI